MQVVQVRLSAKLFFSLLYIIVFRFVVVLVFNHTFPLGLFPFILTASPLQFREGCGTNVFLANEFVCGPFQSFVVSVCTLSFSPFSHTAELGPRLGVYEIRNMPKNVGSIKT